MRGINPLGQALNAEGEVSFSASRFVGQ